MTCVEGVKVSDRPVKQSLGKTQGHQLGALLLGPTASCLRE